MSGLVADVRNYYREIHRYSTALFCEMIPLLMACGLKIAMGNAYEELKSIADYVAPPIEEDGVADAIEKFILK